MLKSLSSQPVSLIYSENSDFIMTMTMIMKKMNYRLLPESRSSMMEGNAIGDMLHDACHRMHRATQTARAYREGSLAESIDTD